MSDSSLLVLRDLTTGAGRTGLSVKLRWITDNFATDIFTCSEIVGKPGVYEVIDAPFNKYKLWVNGVEDKSFGGTHGKWWPTDNLLGYIATNISLDASKITSGQFNVARIPDLGASIITSGIFDIARIPFCITAATNMLLVDSSMSVDQAGFRYRTIQSAINYAQGQAAALASQWYIVIMPGSQNAYIENLTLQPYVHLLGLYGFPLVTGTVTGANANSRLYNLRIKYNGNLTFNNLCAYDSVLYVNGGHSGYALTVGTCQLHNVGLISYGEHAPTIVSSGNNIFTGACWTNVDMAFANGDKGVVSCLKDPILEIFLN